VTTTPIRTWIESAARLDPEAVFLEDARSSRQLTYRQLADLTRRAGDDLDALGLSPAAPLALRVPDAFEYACVLVALLGAGRVVLPRDVAAPQAEEARVASLLRPAATVTGASVRPGVPRLPVTVARQRASARAALPSLGCGLVLCTSGSTGSPKVIHLAEAQLAHVAAAVALDHALRPGERGFSPLPLFHINAEVVGLLATLAGRASLVVDERFHRRDFWQLVASRRVTWINAVPAIITILAQGSEAPTAPTSVRFIRSASAPLAVSILRRFEERFGIPVVESYGMTEASSMIAANPVAGPRKPGSVGRPVGSQLRVVDPDGNDVRNEVGRVLVRGAGVITSYLAGGSPESFRGGWLDTGDLGSLDDDGYLYLAGRADDVINRGGENIHPREVEEVLLEDPRVRAAVVVGEPDPVLGARPVGYVLVDAELQDGHLVEELLARCRAELSPFKVPARLAVVDALPVGPTGKLLRRALRPVAEPVP
jgi:acyl-CoA synthetase (AMP-forming)/AMP-acid ligase II